MPVKVENQSSSYTWGSTAVLREVMSDGQVAILRQVEVPITVADDVQDGSFEPVAIITWGSDPTRKELCDSNGGLHNRLHFRPNGGNQVLIKVSFGCMITQNPVGDPGQGAYVTVSVKSGG